MQNLLPPAERLSGAAISSGRQAFPCAALAALATFYIAVTTWVRHVSPSCTRAEYLSNVFRLG
jgi:hypothetical protein